jgi:predicted XRE-type DNA-binding protein
MTYPLRGRSCSVDGCNKPVLARGWCNRHYRRWEAHGDPLAGRTFVGEPERFLKEVAASHSGDGCLVWPFARNSAGYGNIMLDGRFQTVSRVVCELVNGLPPSDAHETAHLCGKGHEGCVSGGHLRWALPKENQADRYGHGTSAAGSQNSNAKLSEKEVSEIRSLIGRLSQQQIAEKFGVSQVLISRIKLGKAWRIHAVQ